MSLYEFLERLEKDPFDEELTKLVESGFEVVSPNTDTQEKPCSC